MLSEEARDQLAGVIAVTGECIRQGATLPSLILIYSAIDALGWLGDPRPHPSPEAVFTWWVRRWLQSARPLPCTPLELYAARCAVLHTFTSQSKLSAGGNVRRIAYAWGGASSTDLQAKLEAVAPEASVAVDIDALFDGLQIGAAQFFEDALAEPALMAAIQAKSQLYFTAIRVERLADAPPGGAKN